MVTTRRGSGHRIAGDWRLDRAHLAIGVDPDSGLLALGCHHG